jgi:hypothetical protein
MGLRRGGETSTIWKLGMSTCIPRRLGELLYKHRWECRAVYVAKPWLDIPDYRGKCLLGLEQQMHHWLRDRAASSGGSKLWRVTPLAGDGKTELYGFPPGPRGPQGFYVTLAAIKFSGDVLRLDASDHRTEHYQGHFRAGQWHSTHAVPTSHDVNPFEGAEWVPVPKKQKLI